MKAKPFVTIDNVTYQLKTEETVSKEKFVDDINVFFKVSKSAGVFFAELEDGRILFLPSINKLESAVVLIEFEE